MKLKEASGFEFPSRDLIFEKLGRFLQFIVCWRPGIPITAIVFSFFLLRGMPLAWPLNGNEEDYLAQAHKFANPNLYGPYSSIISDSYSIVVFKALMGSVINTVGFERAEVFGRGVAIVAYSIAFAFLADALSLSLLGLISSLCIFFLCGQATMGGEWLFLGVEAKVLSYACVVAALGVYLRLPTKSGVLTFWLALAVYLHFLVGGFWAALLIAIDAYRNGVRSAIGIALPLFVCVLPLLLVLVWERLAFNGMGPDVGHTADWIYSIFRSPHHTSPFANPDIFATFRNGFLLAPFLFALSLFLTYSADTRAEEIFSDLLIFVYAFLLLAIGLSWAFSESGVLGKFYLFRPVSLALLLLIIAVWLKLAKFVKDKGALAAASLVFAVLPPIAIVGASAKNNLKGSLAQIRLEPRPVDAALSDFVNRTVAENAVILVHPRVELLFTERQLGRATYVAAKFIPTRPDQILEWYARVELRNKIIGGDCAARLPIPTYLLLPPEGGPPNINKCWTKIFVDSRASFWRRTDS